MFSKKDSGGAPKAAPAPAPRRGRSAPSIISDDLVVHGNLIATGDIQIDGTVEGDVRSQSLTVGEHATITGEVMADDIVVRGRIVGSERYLTKPFTKEDLLSAIKEHVVSDAD